MFPKHLARSAACLQLDFYFQTGQAANRPRPCHAHKSKRMQPQHRVAEFYLNILAVPQGVTVKSIDASNADEAELEHQTMEQMVNVTFEVQCSLAEAIEKFGFALN